MESVGQLFSGLSLLVLAVGAGAFVVSISIAGLLYVTAFGDPQKISLAKGALMSSLLGILIMAFAPLAPRVLNQVVLEPAGLGSVVQDTGGCDAALRTALITHRNVNSANAANSIIRQMQAQRSDDCGAEIWDPEVARDDFTAPSADGCGVSRNGSVSGPFVDRDIGRSPLPGSMLGVVNNRTSPAAAPTFGGENGSFGAFARDNDGNMLMEFYQKYRPADGSLCWVYIARGNFWDEQA